MTPPTSGYERLAQSQITAWSEAYHCLISSSFFLKFSSFFRPFTFCCCKDSSLSHVLWMYDQPFHLIRYWTSPSSFSGSKSALGLPLASVAYTVVEAPTAARETRLHLVPSWSTPGHQLHHSRKLLFWNILCASRKNTWQILQPYKAQKFSTQQNLFKSVISSFSLSIIQRPLERVRNHSVLQKHFCKALRAKHWLYFHYGFVKGAMKTDSPRSVLYFKAEKSRNCRTMAASLKCVQAKWKLPST